LRYNSRTLVRKLWRRQPNSVMSTTATPPLLGINLDIRDASCRPIGTALDTSKKKKYRLTFDVRQPAVFRGLKKPKSAYVEFNGSNIFWREPFGPSFSLSSTTNKYVATITLRKGHRVGHGQDIGACLIDYSALRGTRGS